MRQPNQIYPILSRWAEYSERFWYEVPGRPGIGCYGTGYNAWGVQTNQKYFAALAVLATSSQSGDLVDRQWALERALASLRFSLSSHLSSAFTCTDGTRWGHTWISALGIERMMHAVYRLEAHLGAQDLADLRRVLTSEADWLLVEYRKGQTEGISAGLWDSSGRNQPESNLWNGALLWRAAVMYPDHANQIAWQERAHQFLINAVSVPADALDETILAGLPVRERFRGANFFPNYALDHHGYLNIGYMAICVSNAAMLHFDLKMKGLPRPETLDHHQADLWQLLRRLIFQNGRLARIGGDTRVRYAYCQEYLLPALAYAADRLKDAQALNLLDRQFEMIEEEAQWNGDGSFYGRRLAELAHDSQYYFTRLESDRACALAQLCAYLPLVSPVPSHASTPQQSSNLQTPLITFEDSVAGSWIELEHGAVLHRSARRLASFAWRAFGLAQGMCQPPSEGHLTDWEGQLCGQVEFVHHPHPQHPAPAQSRRLRDYQILPFPGGFLIFGSISEGAEIEMAEGWRGHDLATHQIVFAALPDDQTVLALEFCRMGPARGLLRQVKGLHFNLVNDLFNHFSRTVWSGAERFTLVSPPGQAEIRAFPGLTACIDQKVGLVGIYGADHLSLHRSARRGAGAFQSLFVEEINFVDRVGPFWANPSEVLLDCGWAVLSGAGMERTLEAGEAVQAYFTQSPGLRAVSITGADQQVYLLVANFSAQPAQQEFPARWAGNSWTDVISALPVPSISLPAYSARLLRVD